MTFSLLKYILQLIYVRSTDTQAEHDVIIEAAVKSGAFAAVSCKNWSEGGAGAVDLANKVIQASHSNNSFQFLYDTNGTIEEKLNIIAKRMYGAGCVELSPKAIQSVQLLTAKVFLISKV